MEGGVKILIPKLFDRIIALLATSAKTEYGLEIMLAQRIGINRNMQLPDTIKNKIRDIWRNDMTRIRRNTTFSNAAIEIEYMIHETMINVSKENKTPEFTLHISKKYRHIPLKSRDHTVISDRGDGFVPRIMNRVTYSSKTCMESLMVEADRCRIGKIEKYDSREYRLKFK